MAILNAPFQNSQVQMKSEGDWIKKKNSFQSIFNAKIFLKPFLPQFYNSLFVTTIWYHKNTFVALFLWHREIFWRFELSSQKLFFFRIIWLCAANTFLIACSNKSVSVVMCGHNNFLRNFFSIFNLNHLLRRISYQHSTNEHKNWMIKGVATITCH